MSKFLKFVYFLMSLISTFFVVRHGNSASPKYCMHGDDCNILCPNPLMGICTDYQCICI
ncbi:putative Late nodulin [Medicago truncatula]|uniref:Putative Late nodulin n=1 Tax=Medicago truncatula TaxID=3880 RepID=A0A396GNS9_MEDTR|nr:putative Late nodulin [Medicago truncatula]